MIAAAMHKATGQPVPGPVTVPPLDFRHLIIPCSDAHPSQANGVHNVARQLSREQIAAGDQARIIFVSSKTAPPDACGVPVEMVPATGASLRGHVVRMRRNLLQNLLVDAGPHTRFHLHGGRDPLLVDIASYLHRAGIPYAVTLHGRYSHVYDNAGHCQRRVTALYLSTVERSMLQNARFVQALSPVEQRIVHRIAPRARVAAIGNGAYSSWFEGEPARPPVRTRSSQFPHFAFCGRYEVWHKGLDLLLEGFAEYKRGGGQGALTLIGSGDREPLKGLAQTLEISDTAQVCGPIYDAERDAVLRGCDYFVMTSRFEGGPLAALEAARLGLPLLMSPGTGMTEIVKSRGAGIAIADATSAAVCEAMREAARLSLAEWSCRSAAAYELVVATGNWTAITAQLRLLYR